MAKQLRKDKKDIIGGYFVRGEDGEILTTEILARWREYFDGLLNEENPNAIEEDESTPQGPLADISEREVREAIQSMKANKAPGPSGMTSDILKAAGESVVRHLVKVFQNIIMKEKWPRDFIISTTIPIYKVKGDPLQCNRYHGLRLLEHGMKLWEKILESRLRLR